jgi:hypothetical protein
MAIPNDERDKLTTNVPNISINVSEHLNPEKIAEETIKLFRSFIGAEDPVDFAEETAKEEEVPVAHASILDPFAESFRILKKAEEADSLDETDRLLRIADRYLGLL